MSNGKDKGFTYSGVVAGRTDGSRRERALQHQKGTKVTMGTGVPRQTEGSVGDITVNKIGQGLRCYIKTNSGWYDINTMQGADSTKWTDMILSGSWATDSDFGAPQYFRDSAGFVHLKGGCDSGSGYSAEIAVLPVGFRPINDIFRLTTKDAALVDVALQGLRVQDSGEINVVKQLDFDLSVSPIWNATESEITADTTVGVCLEGISFYAGQKVIGSGGGSSGGGGAGGSHGGGGA